MCLQPAGDCGQVWREGSSTSRSAIRTYHLSSQQTRLGNVLSSQLEYSRENLYKQRLTGEASKGSQSLSDLGNVQDSQFGFSWDPSQLVPAALDGLFSGGGSSAGIADGPSMPTPLPIGPAEGWEWLWGVCVCVSVSVFSSVNLFARFGVFTRWCPNALLIEMLSGADQDMS